MGSKGAKHGGRSVRLRAVAAFLFALLFGLQMAPLLQAQATQTPDCCMAAEGKGCSMHLHRAKHTQGAGYTVAALQSRCPCTPMAPASAGLHDALPLPESHLLFALAGQHVSSAQPRNLLHAYTTGSGGTRGPPALMLAA